MIYKLFMSYSCQANNIYGKWNYDLEEIQIKHRNMKIMMTLWVCQQTLNKKGFLGKALTKHNLTMTLKKQKEETNGTLQTDFYKRYKYCIYKNNEQTTIKFYFLM